MKSSRIRFLLCMLTIVVPVQFSGCCSSQPEMRTGPRPNSVRGWQESQEGAIKVKGQFVLNKGESTDNGRFGIKILDIYPGKCHLFDIPDFPTTKLQFFRVSDHAVICEWTFKPGSGRLDLPHICKENLDWTAISINEINYKENWVFFELR
jgi:hypothetical protein